MANTPSDIIKNMYTSSKLIKNIIGDANFPDKENYDTDRLKIKKWG
jgi:hypothetical protein